MDAVGGIKSAGDRKKNNKRKRKQSVIARTRQKERRRVKMSKEQDQLQKQETSIKAALASLPKSRQRRGTLMALQTSLAEVQSRKKQRRRVDINDTNKKV